MRITLAKNGGFCYGVQQALDKVLELTEKGLSISTLGPIIHNPLVVDMLRSKGVESVENVEACESTHLVIRSHGVVPSVFDKCRKLGIIAVDATCPYVHKIQQKARLCNKKGVPLIIVGEVNHPETTGINGWNGFGALFINSAQQAEQMPLTKRACVVAQTTTLLNKWEEIIPILKTKVDDLEIFNSICSATKARQTEALEIAGKCDLVFVIGGRNSSNTAKLYDISKSLCENTYHIESVKDISSLRYSEFIHLGIISGASSPEWLIKEVYCTMSDIEKIDTTKENEEVKNFEESIEETKEEVVENAQDTAVEETVSEEKEVEEVVVEEAAQETPVAAQEVSEEEAPVKEEAAEDLEDSDDIKQSEADASFMEDVEKSMVTIKSGMVLTGKVVSVNSEEVCVNIGYKSDGIIPRKEFSANTADDPVDFVKEGDDIEVEVLRVKDEDGNVLLSRKNIEARKNWKKLVEDYEAGCEFKGIGKQAVKGGLVANINGVRAFIPASHLDVRYVNDITEYIGKEMDLKILEIEKHRRRVVASRKQYIIDKEKEEKEAIWNQLEEGITIRGIVRRLTNFGAFVDIGGIDGLVHVTDLAWGRVGHPKDVVSVNEEIDVVVLKVDKSRERISLGYKQTQPKPWDVADEKYMIGSTVTGKVVRIVPFGAFIELEPGLDGLVHISQIADRRIEKVEDAIEMGQIIEAKILDVNATARRISLSIRELISPSSEEGEEDYDDSESVLVDISSYKDE